MRYKDSPEPPASGCAVEPENQNKVMHMQLAIGNATLLGSDGRCTGNANFQSFAVTLVVDDESQADRFFGPLADGGEIAMPLGETFFSPRFGMVRDKFGVFWMIYVAKAQAQSQAAE